MAALREQVGKRWREPTPSAASELDALVREALTDEVVADLLHERLNDARTNDEVAVAWAAGLFEGEGSWGCYQAKLRATVVIGDRDVLERFRDVVGVGTVIRDFSSAAPGGRPMWRWTISNAAVVEVALLFWPYLGERRRDVFAAKLAERQVFITDATRERECEGCDRPFRPPYSRMASRTRFCSDTCRQRYRRRQ